jgi:adenine-specific DNA methylase
MEFQHHPELLEEGEQLRSALLDFIADFSNWDNAAVPEYLETSRALTQTAHESLGASQGTHPLVVDPFAGGGSIPLEALRIGCEAFASDLNPVAVLLNKVILEYIPKYGERLENEVIRQAEWIKAEAAQQLAKLYGKDPDGATPIAYIWARTILSEAPSQSSVPVEIPLIRSMWLATKPSRRRALRWVRDERGQVKTHRVTVTYSNGETRQVLQPILEVFHPSKSSEVETGTSSGGSATCPVTGFTVPVERVRQQLAPRRGGARDSRLLCVVSVSDGTAGRIYRLPTKEEESASSISCAWLNEYETKRKENDPMVPDGSLNHLRGFFNIVLYGMTRWGDAFSSRQLAVLLTLSKLIRTAGNSQKEDGDFSTALEACLALVLGRMADGNSSLARWQPTGEKISNTFGRQALPMVWDYAEANPFCDATRSLDSMFEWIVEVIRHESLNPLAGHAERASATRHPLPNDSADAVVTDPPYYAAVPYADLSDFFYSWLAQALRPRLPELFGEPLTPKAEECVQLSHRAAMYRNKDKAWFEKTMREACGEARRFTKDDGTGLFVFASKETDAWEAMLAALVEANWTVTASWPIDTEMGSRLRAQRSATLASSIHILCRPRSQQDEVGDWRDVLLKLPGRIHEWMPRLAQEGIVGADAIFACLGPALEVFSKYARVEKANGDQVTLEEYLSHVWAAVSREALAMVFEGADASGFEEDSRLTAMWLWTLSTGNSDNANTDADETDSTEEDEDEEGDKSAIPKGYILEYDAARKIAQGLGAHLETLTSLVEVKGETARLLPVADRTRKLFGRNEVDSSAAPRNKKTAQLQLGFIAELEQAEEAGGWGGKGAPTQGATVLDRVHQCMILFAAGRSEALRRFLVDEGVGKDERFWRLAQVLSYLYPKTSDEKRWIDGVLARKKGIGF